MEKLSSILPSNNRITTVDTPASHAVRSGVASFGRPIATHERRPNLTSSDMLNISDAAHEISRHPDQTKIASKEVENQYFANRRAEIEERAQQKAEMQDIRPSFEPDDKMHIADNLSTLPSVHASPSPAAESGTVLPRAVERMQARAFPGSRPETGGHLSVLA